jgi:hypothetical protein
MAIIKSVSAVRIGHPANPTADKSGPCNYLVNVEVSLAEGEDCNTYSVGSLGMPEVKTIDVEFSISSGSNPARTILRTVYIANDCIGTESDGIQYITHETEVDTDVIAFCTGSRDRGKTYSLSGSPKNNK